MDRGAEQAGGEGEGLDDGEGAAPTAAPAAWARLLHLLRPVRAPVGKRGQEGGDTGISYLSQSPSNKTLLRDDGSTMLPHSFSNTKDPSLHKELVKTWLELS